MLWMGPMSQLHRHGWRRASAATTMTNSGLPPANRKMSKKFLTKNFVFLFAQIFAFV
jgi:hypothetical protein